MFYITKKNLPYLLLGSGFLGTGGGLNFQDRNQVFKNIFQLTTKIRIQGIEEFPKNGYLVTAYGVGDPSVDVSRLIKEAISDYQRLTRIKIQGIIPGEIGAEVLAFQAGVYSKLSVVDSDLVGGRAAPGIQMDVFSVYSIPLTPILGVSLNGKKILLSGKFSPKEIEKILRDFFEQNGGAGAVVGYPIKADAYRKTGMQGTISRAIKIGECLSKKDLKSLVQNFQCKIIAKEKIIRVNLQRKEGFKKGFITLQNHKILVKNENIAAWKGKKRIIAVPEGIMLLNELCVPIHNSDIQKYVGKVVALVTFSAMSYWRKKSNRKLWESAFK